MNIIYGYSNCSDNKYEELFKDNNSFVLRADQKYHSLLIKGLAQNNVNASCYSGLPINRKSYNKLVVNEKDEYIDGVKYHYYKTINLPIIRQLLIFIGGFVNTLKIDNKDTYLICDYQNLSNAYGMLLASKIKGIKSTLIVMDLPEYLVSNKLLQKIYMKTYKLANSYILLTKYMNDKVNKDNKPYVVIEGLADSNTKLEHIDKYENTINKKVVMYAGSINKKYGIDNLIEGFIKANIKDSELWIYGDGDYKEELIDICKKNNNVIYKGIVSNKEIIEEEKNASLLVNPRPIGSEYTRYSFPSKTIEYMLSGTPLLTTKLLGIPDEYFDFVYVLKDDKKEDIAYQVETILSKDITTRNDFSTLAYDFISDKCSETIQAKKAIDLLNKYE